MVVTDILEKLQEDWLRLSRGSFDNVDCGLAANVVQEAIDEITRLRETNNRSSEQAGDSRKILRWLSGSGVGLSSKAIALTALGEMPNDPNYPHDPDDFSRCKGLLENIPFARRGLEKLGTDGGYVWAALVARWDEIDALFETAEQGGWDKDDGKCYRLMRSIIDAARPALVSKSGEGS